MDRQMVTETQPNKKKDTGPYPIKLFAFLLFGCYYVSFSTESEQPPSTCV